MVFIAITSISYIYIHYVEEYIKKSSLEQLESVGSFTEDKVELYIQQMHDKLELFNTRMFLYEKLAESEKGQSEEIKNIVGDILEYAYAKEEDILDIVILDEKSHLIASKSRKNSLKESFIKSITKQETPRQQTKLIYNDDKTTPLLYISSPILKDKKFLGTSIFVIKTAYLNKLLTNDVEMGKTGEIFMGSKTGDKLILFSPLKFSNYPMYCTNKDFHNYISKQILLPSNEHITVQKALDYRKVPVVLSLHYNKTLQAVIVVKKDIEELMEPIQKIKQYQLIILFITIIIIVLASLLISNRIIKTIKNIVRITSNISKGKYKERISVYTNDELGELGESINKMADFMVNANEISEAKVEEQTRLLQESNEKLQQYNQSLSTVIKSLSHDIKTPLTIIDGYIEELDDGMIQYDDIPRVTAILKKETAYLNELTFEVISYIQSKELVDEQREQVLLYSFLYNEIFPLLRIPQGVKLLCELDENTTIEFNRISLKKIFINLLHNASKYTSSGTIKVRLKGKDILIEDTGIGIDPQFSKAIFEPFFGLDESRNREKNGFGLGLSIASNLAQTNGYTLELDTSYTDGSRFILKQI